MAKNNTPLNIEKVVSFIKEDIFSKEYHCPNTDAAIVLETLRKLHEEHDLKWIEQAARYYALYSHNLLQDERRGSSISSNSLPAIHLDKRRITLSANSLP